jgi:hypothetical protein
MIYYLDDFLQRLIKAHNKVATDQGKAVAIVKSIISDFNPEDEEIVDGLNAAIRVGLDSPIDFKKHIVQVMNRAKANHAIMLQEILKRKNKNAK